MLRGIFTDEDLLKALVIAYFDPDTAGNLALRQALSYFLPVYCHSRIENLTRMTGVAVPVLRHLMLVQENRDDDEDDDDEVGMGLGGGKGKMVGLGVVAGHLVEWTDCRRLVGKDRKSGDGDDSGKEKEMMMGHVVLARNVLERICSGGCQRMFYFPLSLFSTEAVFPVGAGWLDRHHRFPISFPISLSNTITFKDDYIEANIM